MIRDLSLSLREMLTKAGATFPELAAAQIVFDRPTDSFNPAQPTLSLYLYDVRENQELRSNETLLGWSGGMATLQRAPMRVACSYLVTAWPGTVTGDEVALREHRLLSQVLTVFARNPLMPEEHLQGLLMNQDPPLPLVCAHVDSLKNPSEFWTALNNKLRPALTLTATISVQAYDAITAPPVAAGEVRIKSNGVAVSDTWRIGGIVTDAASAAIAGAQVALSGTSVVTGTGSDGRFVLGTALRAGNYTLHVSSGTAAKDFAITVPPAAAGGYDLVLA